LLTALPASQREVLRLLKVNGFTIEEVARTTSSTADSVKQKIHREYAHLRGPWKQTTAVTALMQTRRSVH
jgi:DNA-directed RNA polymerase specialized sigma24 family protein